MHAYFCKPITPPTPKARSKGSLGLQALASGCGCPLDCQRSIASVSTGEARGSDGQAARSEGRWELPYLGEEHAEDDPELRATAAGNAAAQRLRDAFLANAKPVGSGIPQQALFAETQQLSCQAHAR